MTESKLVLYQRQIAVAPGYTPARTATVYPLTENALQTAISDVRFGFTPHAVSFKELPPEKVLLRACEEAIRAGRAIKLPTVDHPRPSNALMKGLSRHVIESI